MGAHPKRKLSTRRKGNRRIDHKRRAEARLQSYVSKATHARQAE